MKIKTALRWPHERVKGKKIKTKTTTKERKKIQNFLFELTKVAILKDENSEIIRF